MLLFKNQCKNEKLLGVLSQSIKDSISVSIKTFSTFSLHGFAAFVSRLDMNRCMNINKQKHFLCKDHFHFYL